MGIYGPFNKIKVNILHRKLLLLTMYTQKKYHTEKGRELIACIDSKNKHNICNVKTLWERRIFIKIKNDSEKRTVYNPRRQNLP